MTFTLSIWAVLLFGVLWLFSVYQMGLSHFFKQGHEQGVEDAIAFLDSVGYIVVTDDDYIIGLSNSDQLKHRGLSANESQKDDITE